MSLRDKRQEEFANIYLDSMGKGILYLCPRFGKCRVGVIILKQLEKRLKYKPKVLIAYPDTKVEYSWKEEFKLMKYTNKNVTFSTHLSLHKHKQEWYDLIILDEIHLLSENQISVVQDMDMENDRILGLTGTLSSFTERDMKKYLGLTVMARYPIEKAIEEGVITDYLIHIKTVKLDNKIVQPFKTPRTEKDQFEAYSAIIRKLETQGKDTFFLRLARMRVIQKSISKRNATIEMLKEFKDERVLVFCGQIPIAESLGCPVYHSKSKDKTVFDDFATGKGNHLAVIKIGNTGVTYKPLSKVIINYFDSNSENLAQKINRCMAMEYNNSDKKAEIHIITTNEEVELKWLKKALEFFDPKKIKFD